MIRQIIKVALRYEQDIVLARQRARAVANLLGFDTNDQTRISTAVSEIARNAYQYAGGGEVIFAIDGDALPQFLLIQVIDHGPGIADLQTVMAGRYVSQTGMGLGLIGAQRLMDSLDVVSPPGKGTTVEMRKRLPAHSGLVTQRHLARLAEELAKLTPQNPVEEIQRQNQELILAMEELMQRQQELEHLNRELADTNRGILALYAELDEKAAHLSKANDLKVRFLSNMSHEFRTPLNSILSLSRLLMDRLDGDLTEEQEKQVLFIRRAAEDLSALVNDLLDIAKIEAGKIDVHVAPFEIEELFSALRGMLKPLMVNPQVNLVFDTDDMLPTIVSDEGKVSQILRNLISNAIKFTEAGEIRVSARTTDGGARLILEVRDTGIGIPEADLERIFEEYAQVDSPLQRKNKGTGLGLPLTRRLVELLGGTITVRSTLGIGSVFTVTIPVQYECAADEAQQAQQVVDTLKLPVLVVEDDPATSALYDKYLKGTGFQVITARSVREARHVLSQIKPIAVILDILINSGDSWSFLSDLKSDADTMNIPVFVASVLDDTGKGYALGADDFVTKPVDRQWLLTKCREVVKLNTRARVLVIDDEEVARYIMRGLLADTKFEMLEAADGASGIRMAAEMQPDLIFLDLVMPGMNGFEVLKQLKDHPTTADIPVVIVSSKQLDESERHILMERAVSVVSKGVVTRDIILSQLRRAVDAAFRRR